MALLFALYLTGSRASWLATAIVAVAIVLVARNWRLFAAGLVLSAIFVAAYITKPAVHLVVDTSIRLERGLTYRPILWGAARGAWSRSVLIGHGVEATSEEMERAARYPNSYDRMFVAHLVRVGSAHNFYLEMLAETGVIGLLLLLFLVFTVLRIAWQARRSRDPWRATYALATFAVTIGILVHSFFERSVLLGLMSYTVFYWFLVAQTLRADDPGSSAEDKSAVAT